MADRDWRDDPALAHLRDDAPYVVCSACGRKSWGGNAAGEQCGMTQPDGTSCEGVFGLPEMPASGDSKPDASNQTGQPDQ